MKLITLEEASRLYEKPVETLQKYCREGKMPCQKVGRDWMIAVDDDIIIPSLEQEGEPTKLPASPEEKAQKEAEFIAGSKARQAESEVQEQALKHGFATSAEYVADLEKRETDQATEKIAREAEKAEIGEAKKKTEDKAQEQERIDREQEEKDKRQAEVDAKLDDRYANLTIVEKQKLAKRKVYVSLLERQRRAMPLYLESMGKAGSVCWDIKPKKILGMKKVCDEIWDNIEQIQDWMGKDGKGFDKHADEIFAIMKADMEKANQVAVKLYRIYDKSTPNPLASLFGQKEDSQSKGQGDIIVDNLELIGKVLWEIKPEAWCKLDFEDEALLKGIIELLETDGKHPATFHNLVSFFKVEDIARLEYLLATETREFYKLEETEANEEISGGTWDLVVNQKRKA